jgi:hypothetical protein
MDFTLAERVIQGSDIPHFRMNFKQARRFMLSKDFMTRVYQNAPKSVERAIARCDLARLPFERVWLEIDEQIMADAASAANVRKVGPREGNGILGYYIYRNPAKMDDPTEWRADIYISNPDFRGGEVMCMPLSLQLGRVGELFHDMQYLQRRVTEIVSATAWGYFEAGSNKPIIADDLLAKGMMCLDPGFMQELMKREGIHGKEFVGETAETFYRLYTKWIFPMVQTCTGDLQFLITTLAMINHIPTRTIHVARSGFYRKRLKNHPYLDYQCIEIDTSRVRSERSIGRLLGRAEHDAIKKRAHEVRGHWRYYLQMPRCNEVDHVWEVKDHNHHTCQRCGTRRTWIDAHQRGDASIGYVTHDYEVVN